MDAKTTSDSFSYEDACAFLDRLTDYERADGYRYDDKNFNLTRTRELLRAAGNPQAGLAGALIAGTKGKGSTAAMLASILKAAGRKTGLYTSPHLQEYRERIRLGLEPVSRDAFARLAAGLVRPVADILGRSPPTTFEVLTVMALVEFARARVDDVVLEVGMGGRLDATNVFEPLVVCITPVSFDHMDQLGDTIEAITAEKAGIIKSAAPVICGPQRPEALAVIEGACRKAGASMLRVGAELSSFGVRVSDSVTNFSARFAGRDMKDLELGLLGRHQVDNALLAIGAALALRPDISEQDIRHGLRDAFWPGRLQLLASDRRILLDGAHNPAAAETLARALREIFPGRKPILLLGHLRGKDTAGFASIICPLAERVFVPELAHPRALPAREVAERARPYAGKIEIVDGVSAALDSAKAASVSQDLILVTGSLALVGEVLRAENAPVN